MYCCNQGTGKKTRERQIVKRASKEAVKLIDIMIIYPIPMICTAITFSLGGMELGEMMTRGLLDSINKDDLVGMVKM